MYIIFDVDYDDRGLIVAQHTIDPDSAEAMATIAAIQSGKTDAVKAGYVIKSKLPGLTQGATRWDVLVAESQKANAHPAIKAIGLTAAPVAAIE